jgi:hypothetical protein
LWSSFLRPRLTTPETPGRSARSPCASRWRSSRCGSSSRTFQSSSRSMAWSGNRTNSDTSTRARGQRDSRADVAVAACAASNAAAPTGLTQARAVHHQPGRNLAERFVVPLKPGNAGGGKGPQFKTNARRGEGPGDWATYQLRTCSETAEGVARESKGVKSCPRAGCGKSACPVR